MMAPVQVAEFLSDSQMQQLMEKAFTALNAPFEVVGIQKVGTARQVIVRSAKSGATKTITVS